MNVDIMQQLTGCCPREATNLEFGPYKFLFSSLSLVLSVMLSVMIIASVEFIDFTASLFVD